MAGRPQPNAEPQHFRRQFVTQIDWLTSECDFLVAPTAPITAAPISNRRDDYGRNAWMNTGIFDLTSQPSIPIPCGFTSAVLPIGSMITGRWLEDRTVLRFAHAVEQATTRHRATPIL